MAVYIPPHVDTGVALSELHNVLCKFKKNTQTQRSLWLQCGTLMKLSSDKWCQILTNMIHVRQGGLTFWITVTHHTSRATKLIHIQHLESQISAPFSSCQNINKTFVTSQGGTVLVCPIRSHTAGCAQWCRLGHALCMHRQHWRVCGCSS